MEGNEISTKFLRNFVKITAYLNKRLRPKESYHFLTSLRRILSSSYKWELQLLWQQVTDEYFLVQLDVRARQKKNHMQHFGIRPPTFIRVNIYCWYNLEHRSYSANHVANCASYFARQYVWTDSRYGVHVIQGSNDKCFQERNIIMQYHDCSFIQQEATSSLYSGRSNYIFSIDQSWSCRANKPSVTSYTSIVSIIKFGSLCDSIVEPFIFKISILPTKENFKRTTWCLQ